MLRRRLIKGGFLTGGLGILLAAVCLLLPPNQVWAQARYLEPIPITPQALMDAYRNNFQKADAMYTGKLLILTGRVRTIMPPRHPYAKNDYAFLTMDAPGHQPVAVYLWEWDAEYMARVTTGRNMSVMGFCQGVYPQLSLIHSCVYPKGCGGPVAGFPGPYYQLPPSK